MIPTTVSFEITYGFAAGATATVDANGESGARIEAAAGGAGIIGGGATGAAGVCGSIEVHITPFFAAHASTCA